MRYTFVLALILAPSSLSWAGTIGPLCATCQGGVYTLTYTGTLLPDNDPVFDTFQSTFQLDPTGYTGLGAYVSTVAVKIAAPSNFHSAALFSAPVALSDWTLTAAGLGANGCSGGSGGFICIAWNGPGPGATLSAPLTWTFNETIRSSGHLLLGSDDASIKVRYVTSDGKKAGDLVSEPITLSVVHTPEPATFALIGLGLAGVGLFARRRGA